MHRLPSTTPTTGAQRATGTQRATGALLALAALSALATPTDAQFTAPEVPGPFTVGWQDVSFAHPLSGNPVVDARLYYPALGAGQDAAPDPSSGPFPQVGFLHGYFAFVDYYDDVCSHLASHGFFVASVATESGFFMSIPKEAADARAMLTWVEEQAGAGGPFAGMVQIGGDWSAVGHSNGGAASFHLASSEPRVERLVLFEPNWTNPPGVAAFEGAVMVVGASEDLITPSSFNAQRYYDELVGTPRRFYTTVIGSGHNGSLDFPFEITSLPHSEAQAMHRRLATAFLQAEVLGDEDAYAWSLSELAEQAPLDPRSRAVEPVLWARVEAGALRLGIAGREQDAQAWLAIGDTPATLPTSFGTLGILLTPSTWLSAAPMPSDGSRDVLLPIPAALAGATLGAQGLRLAPDATGALTRTAWFTL
jgi:dienelactone hydrolase